MPDNNSQFKEKYISQINNNRFAKNFILVISLFAAIITIYTFFLEKRAVLQFEIISDTNVLDLNAEVGKLEVFYDSTNIEQSGENLRVYSVRISNSGNSDLLQEFYDQNIRYGIRVKNGKIIEYPELTQSSNEYLSDNSAISDFSSDSIFLKKVILEPKEFFVIKFLVLHPEKEKPEILSFGKIAGQHKIQVFNSIVSDDKSSVLLKSFQGSIIVQIIRLIIYFVVGVFLLIIGIMLIVSIHNFVVSMDRKKLIKKFIQTNSIELSKIHDEIFDMYEEEGIIIIDYSKKLLEDEIELQRFFTSVDKSDKNIRLKTENGGIKFLSENISNAIKKSFLENGIVFINTEKNVQVNPNFKKVTFEFWDFLVTNDPDFEDLKEEDLS